MKKAIKPTIAVKSAAVCAGALLVLFCYLPPAAAKNEGVSLERSLEVLELQDLGEKREGLKIEHRLDSLERRHRITPPPRASETYRLQQLFAIQQGIISQEQQLQAIQAYNRGVDAAMDGDYQDAIEAYIEALSLNPNLAEAANNLAAIYQSQYRYEEAATIYEGALGIDPEQPLLWRNLGTCLEYLGDIRAAIDAYNMYLERVDTADPGIVELVRTFREQETQTDAEDYLIMVREASHGEALTWPRSLNPLKVYIRHPERDQVQFLPALRRSLDQWEEATRGRLKFEETHYPSIAQIFITLTPGPLLHPVRDVGHADYDVYRGADGSVDIHRIRVRINTGDTRDAQALAPDVRREYVHRLALHELGHAIGIWGHSANPGDIMYTHPVVTELSSRDIRTIQRLYGVSEAKFLPRQAPRPVFP